jgi:hypothetical protein
VGSQSTATADTTASSDMNVSNALTLCEYSHCCLAASKCSGVTVQLLLRTFIG